MKRTEVLAGLGTVMCLAGARAAAQDQPVLHAAGPPNDGFKAMYYGVSSGIFAKYGLTVQITSVNNGAAAAAALIAGDIQVAMVNILTLIQAHLRGIAMRMIAPNVLDSSARPFSACLVLKDSPLHTGRDLAGKTIGIPGLGDMFAVTTKAWIDKTGGVAQDAHFIELPSSGAASYLEQGRADVMCVLEPFASQALATGNVRLLANTMESIAKQIQVGSYVVMEPFVVSHFEAMANLARGLHDASAYTNSHLAETVALVAAYSGAPPDTVARMNRVIDPEYCDVHLIQPVIDVLAKYGAIDRQFPAVEIISSAALKPSH